MRVSWNAADDRSFYATVGTCRAFVALRLVVEKLPESNCWGLGGMATWSLRNRAQNRKERSPASAMNACETAAKTWIVNNRRPRC